MNKYNKIYKCMMAVVLLLFIGAMCVANILTPDKLFSDSENRNLEQKPKFSFEQLINRKFTTNFENYVSDQFAFRDFWIGVKSTSEEAIGKKENNGVYLGKDGFLIQKFQKPSSGALNEKVQAINSFAASLPKVNKYCLIAPTATSVLKDKLPAYADTDNENEYIDKLKSSLNSSVKFIDVSGVLDSKSQEDLYYKTDHHWTTDGAFYAYDQLGKYMGFSPYKKDFYQVKEVTDSFYGSLYSKGGFRNLSPDDIKLYIPKIPITYKVQNYDTNQTSNSFYVMNDLSKKDKYAVFFGGNYSLLKITTNITNKKKILIIKDSYANSVIPFLAEHYNEIYVVDLRYYSDNLDTLVKSNNIGNILILYNVNTFFTDSSIENINQ